MKRRGRVKLPRGYYLCNTAKKGGLQAGDSMQTMPVVANLGQENDVRPIPVNEATEYRTVETAMAGAQLLGTVIRLGAIALLGYLGYKVVKGEI
ncbi:MAG: hypothetical protein GF375_02365 [Candidatus Omnitrophica bacterium]|nr:hypothetical protein [Candidatus Omnitrophota bacterium]